MPKQYESMKRRLIAQGLSNAEAKKRAAKMYNAQRKEG